MRFLASALAAGGDGSSAPAPALEEARLLQWPAARAAKSMEADLPRLERDADYAAAVATQFYTAHHVVAASVIWGRAVLAGHRSSTGLLTYALSLQHQGRADEAIRVFRAAAECFPSAAAAQFQVYPQLFCENGDKRHFSAAREWSRRYAPGPPAVPHANPDRRGRKLHIGYVAPWFANCQLAQFMAPLLENHDPSAVDITLYPTDAVSETSWPSWIRARSLGGLDDAQAAAQIRRDGVDVLADCWGHSAGSRLPVFGPPSSPGSGGVDQLRADHRPDPGGLRPACRRP